MKIMRKITQDKNGLFVQIGRRKGFDTLNATHVTKYWKLETIKSTEFSYDGLGSSNLRVSGSAPT